jgi:dephospho-CoA kinase
MLFVGLTGNFGCGKSAALKKLGEYPDVAIFDCDKAANEILVREQMQLAAEMIFGKEVFDRGRLVPGRVAEILFTDDDRREAFEQLLHPLVIEEMYAAVAKARREGKKLFVAESAIIFEKGLERLFDRVLVVTCPADMRRRRLKEMRGFTDEDFDLREAVQMPAYQKLELADAIIINDGMLDCLGEQVRNVWRSLPDESEEGFAGTIDRMLKWRHGDPLRVYYTWLYVEHTLKMLKDVRHHAANPSAIEWALKFQHAYFLPSVANNKEMSARLASDWLDEDLAEEVARLIMVTVDCDPDDGDIDSQIMSDCELAILAASPPVFQNLEWKLWMQYRPMTATDFRTRRIAQFKSLMEREHIFRTDHFRLMYERQARENLETAIQRFTAK